MFSHPENPGACFDSTTIVSEARTVARPKVSVVSHTVNSWTCLDTTSSVSAEKQSWTSIFRNKGKHQQRFVFDFLLIERHVSVLTNTSFKLEN